MKDDVTMEGGLTVRLYIIQNETHLDERNDEYIAMQVSMEIYQLLVGYWEPVHKQAGSGI